MGGYRAALWRRDFSSRAFALLLGGCLFVLTSCIPLSDNVLRNPDGEIIDTMTIDPILNDSSLTEDQKRQQLLDLGISEDLTDTLLRASPSG